MHKDVSLMTSLITIYKIKWRVKHDIESVLFYAEGEITGYD